MTRPKVLNKLRNKFIYLDNARSQMNVSWGEVYSMDEAPPGTSFTHEEDIGRSEVNSQGKIRQEFFGREGMGEWEIERKRDDSGSLMGVEDCAYTLDSKRWTEEELSEMRDYLDEQT